MMTLNGPCRKRATIPAILLGILLWLPSAPSHGQTAGNASPDTVTVFAAASTTDVMTAIGHLFAAATNNHAVFSFAASSTLAKQIANGAPADIFLSADQAWMDFLEERQAIDPATRVNLLGNRLVLVAPAASPLSAIPINQGMDLQGALAGGRLAVGDPDHVPAGRYAKAALVKLNAWQAVASHLAPCATVRMALALVEHGETPLGIVYATDAATTAHVRVVGTFPSQSHPDITYPVALVAGHDHPGARRFLQFLQSDPARKVFQTAGFTLSQ